MELFGALTDALEEAAVAEGATSWVNRLIWAACRAIVSCIICHSRSLVEALEALALP